MVSRALTETELKYPPIEGEALALVWVPNHLHHLVEGAKVLGAYRSQAAGVYLQERGE